MPFNGCSNLKRTWWSLQIWSVLWLQRVLYWASRPTGHLAHIEHGAPQTEYKQTILLYTFKRLLLFPIIEPCLAAGRSSVLRVSDRLTGEFHQVSVRPSHCNALDFSCRPYTLWRRGLPMDNVLQAVGCPAPFFFSESADSGCSADGDDCCRRSHFIQSLIIVTGFVVNTANRLSSLGSWMFIFI